MKRLSTRILLTSSAVLALAAPALAQKVPDLPQPAVPPPAVGEVLDNKGIERRLQRDEQALRELRQIVLQSKAQGNPVTVKDAGPDPEVEALKQRINDLEETIRKQNGQIEETARGAQLAAKAAADASAANQALAQRLDRIEQPLLAAGAAALAGQQQGQPIQQPGQPGPNTYQAAPPPPPPQGGGVLGSFRERGSGAGQPRDIQDNPQDTAGKGASAEDEPSAYRNARKVLDSGDYAGGATALKDYLDRYPTSARAPEANYWLGRTLAVQNMHAEAASAYARALKGWPQTSWAGDAVVRLASSLVELRRESDACKALSEFNSRYRTKAAAQIRARAKDIGGQASCS